MFTRIKRKLLLFPRVADSRSFLDEFVCVVAVYDDEQRRIRYTKAETQRDDALHATNYGRACRVANAEGRSQLRQSPITRALLVLIRVVIRSALWLNLEH